MATTYIGEKYVPSLDGEWNNTRSYERLSMVTQTTGQAINTYISRQPVPVGAEITDTSYWMLMYISRIGDTTDVEWTDILNRPTTFPPADHTQDWTTILNTPATYPPSAHNQAIATINGLQTTLTDLQTQINNIGPGGITITEMRRESITGADFPAEATYTIYSNGYKKYEYIIHLRSVALTSWQGLYRSASAFNIYGYKFPEVFVNDPVSLVSVSQTGAHWATLGGSGGSTLREYLNYVYIISAMSTSATVDVHYTVKGF